MALPYAHVSESVFAEYLDGHRVIYEREYFVDPGNIDFLVISAGQRVYCDVKAIVEPPEMRGRVEAQHQIRDDLRSLRRKFAAKPSCPCVLVAMNYSPQIFTGLTIQTAMFGDLGVEFVRQGEEINASDPFHLRRGHAALTREHKTGISGILAFDRAHGVHCYFPNPYAALTLPANFFPGVREIVIDRADPTRLIGDDDPMFFP